MSNNKSSLDHTKNSNVLTRVSEDTYVPKIYSTDRQAAMLAELSLRGASFLEVLKKRHKGFLLVAL